MSDTISKFSSLINLTLFQIAWFVILYSSTLSLWSVGFIALVLLWVAHLVWIAKEPARDLKLMIFALMLGGILDSILMALGFTIFPEKNIAIFSWLVPAWMAFLWAGFPTILNGVLGFMANRPVFAILFGLFGGPLAYFFGEKLGALEVGHPHIWGYAGIGLVWAVAMPTLYWFSNQISPQTEND